MASLRCSNSLSTAKPFVQLSRYRCSHVPTALPPDFLLPLKRRPADVSYPESYQRGIINDNVRDRRIPSRLRSRAKHDDHIHRQTRPFSSSPQRLATMAIFNPQLDEEKKEMKLEITPRAAKVSTSLLRIPATQPCQRLCHRFMPMLTAELAPLGSDGQRREPTLGAAHPGRKRWVPRFSVPDEPGDATRVTALAEVG